MLCLTGIKRLPLILILAAILVFRESYGQSKDNGSETNGRNKVFSKIEVSLGSSLKLGRGPEYLKDIRVPTFGFVARLGLVHKLNPRIQLSLNVSYIQKGMKLRVYSEDFSTTPPTSSKLVTDNTLNYLEVALVPRYSIFNRDRLYVGAGPYIAYLINSRFGQEYFENGELVYRTGSIINSNDNYKNSDFGASAIIGSNFSIGERIKLVVQFNYSIGLAEINKPGIDTIKNNSFSLQIGISFNRLKMLHL